MSDKAPNTPSAYVPKPKKPSNWGVKTKPTTKMIVVTPSKKAPTIPGLHMVGNAVRFQLTATDPLIAHYVGTGLITVNHTQADLTYWFEFHPMHTTGNPVYIRMDGDESNKLMTKFDTKNKPNAPQWADSSRKTNKEGDFANPEKVTLASTARSTMLVLISQNYANLQALAQQVYEVDGLV
ncbi:MAG TPA: hypothetical protein VGC80_15265 [Acetobacteraceae bacterium]